MKIDVLFAGVAISDLGTASQWYQLLFGRAHDITVNDDEVMWQIASSGWLYLVADPLKAGHASVALALEDLEAALSEIAERGLRSGPIEIVPGSGRKASFSDPDGNLITFIEVRRD
jgi:predicted enzyme related to lactoylglutathione lyase